MLLIILVLILKSYSLIIYSNITGKSRNTETLTTEGKKFLLDKVIYYYLSYLYIRIRFSA